MSAITFAFVFTLSHSLPSSTHTHCALSKIQYFFSFLKMEMDSIGPGEQISERGESTLCNM